MQKITEATKYKEKRGTGKGKDYKPWILTREYSGQGTCYNPIDWKTGRQMQLLTTGEYYYWYLYRWNDHVADIREHYPLHINETIKLAEMLGLSHPAKGSDFIHMTTDLLLTLTDGTEKAISVKDNRNALDDIKQLVYLYIEMKYWQMHDVPFEIVFREDIDSTLVNNVRLSVDYYDPMDVHDKTSLLKNLIAHKIVKPDLSKSIYFNELADSIITDEFYETFLQLRSKNPENIYHA